MTAPGSHEGAQTRLRIARRSDAALQLRQVSVWLTDGGKGDEPAPVLSAEVKAPSIPSKLFPTVLKLRM
jgi:hypothetical protein